MTERSYSFTDRQKARQPRWLGFDADFYVLRYPEAKVAMGEKKYGDSYLYYCDIGRQQGHSPNRYFDEIWYCERHQDVRRGLSEGLWQSGFEHYCQTGFLTHAPHWLFDEESYRRKNPWLTVTEFRRQGFWNGYDHFLEVGDKAGLRASSFYDATLVRDMASRYPEWFGEEGLFASWLVLPSEIADSGAASYYFDPKWYCQTYPDVKTAIEKGRYLNALHHYLTNETPSRYNPCSSFSEDYYLINSPDIVPTLQAGGFRNGYDHFVKFGAFEGRTPFEGIDFRAYSQNLLVQAQCESGLFDSPFTRFIAELAGKVGSAGALIPAMAEEESRSLFRQSAEFCLPLLAHYPLDFTVEGLPEVSVIMVVHNQIALTLQTLSSLRNNYRGAIELILIDSGSQDETLSISALVKGAFIYRDRINSGYLEGCNRALDYVHAPVVLYLNNDLRLFPEAVSAALTRLYAEPSIGAVTAKLVRSNMRLQEAGSIIWRDGATYGYRREDDPTIPEANFVRDVDYGSAAFLMVHTGLVKRLQGYDVRYKPAYFEDTDFCVRLAKTGARIVYEPLVVVEHLEFGTSGHAGSHALIQKHLRYFSHAHQDFLRLQQPPHIRNALLGRERKRQDKKRILFIEDRIPIRSLGSGYVRSNDIVCSLARMGYHVTVFPVQPVTERACFLYDHFPEEVELAVDQNKFTLATFLEERVGYYDVLWIARTHNLDQLQPVLGEASRFLIGCHAILDTEVVAAPRTILHAHYCGKPGSLLSLDKLLAKELASAAYCQQVIAVTEHDAALIRQAGHDNVSILGHSLVPHPTQKPFAERQHMLFLGAFHDKDSPNMDSMVWFIREVLPVLVEKSEASDWKLRIAGYIAPSVDLTEIASHPNVEIIGPVEDLAPLFDSHRLFVAPTRFAGGLPYKLHEAASFGLPIVTTPLLRDQVNWPEGEALLSVVPEDPDGFAAAIERLYKDEELWTRLRQNALEAVTKDANPLLFQKKLGEIMSLVKE
ncbi:glycosyltransferase [Acetobacteraceae bacterium ESL0709]|nr:glycosyltransferase [Acetobacteraceae bacterium ESL0697]MDF7677288.1 glycosyltransferase [Acetobacteraceae bacterium ESL0709]